MIKTFDSVVVVCPYCKQVLWTKYPFEHVRFRCQACHRQFTLAYESGRWVAKQVVRPEELDPTK